MAADYTWQGADQLGAPFDIGSGGSNIYMTRSQDWATPPATSPIPAGSSSIERYVRGQFSGDFNNITDVKVYRSDASLLNTGIVIKAGGLADGLGLAFATPSTVPNADAAIPVGVPGSPNLSVDGSGATRYAPALVGGNNRWVRLQVDTAAGTPQGAFSEDTPNAEVTLSYLEN